MANLSQKSYIICTVKLAYNDLLVPLKCAVITKLTLLLYVSHAFIINSTIMGGTYSLVRVIWKAFWFANKKSHLDFRVLHNPISCLVAPSCLLSVVYRLKVFISRKDSLKKRK